VPREIIASMALRGALAGARLRTRFADDGQWNRFRWLRLRTAMSNMETLRASTRERRGFYEDAFSREAWVDKQEADFSDKPATMAISWYRPNPGFWPQASELLNAFTNGYRPAEDQNIMTDGAPLPQPVIRQVPRE
jgi:hypothetical protein